MKNFLSFVFLFFFSLSLKAADFTIDGNDYNILSPSDYTVSLVNCRANFGKITIPETISFRGKTFTIVSIGELAFLNNEASEIILPNSITVIGEDAFLGAKASHIRLSENIRRIGSHAFAGSELTEITLPDSYIINFNNTLDGTFQNCKKLKKVTLGKNVAGGNGTHLISMSKTFRGCDNLEEVIIFCSIPPYWEQRSESNGNTNDPFDKMSYAFATLKVPSDALVDYKSAPMWRNFGTIISIDGKTAYQATLDNANNLIKGIKRRDHAAIYTEIVDDDSKIPLCLLYSIWDLPNGKMCIAGGLVPFDKVDVKDMICEFVGIVDSLMDFNVPTKNGGTLSFNGISGENIINVSEPNQSFILKVKDTRQY